MNINKEVVKEKSIRGGVIFLVALVMVFLGFVFAGVGWILDKMSEIFKNPDKFTNTAIPIAAGVFLFLILIGSNALGAKRQQ